MLDFSREVKVKENAVRLGMSPGMGSQGKSRVLAAWHSVAHPCEWKLALWDHGERKG